jgi:hypothetical protein
MSLAGFAILALASVVAAASAVSAPVSQESTAAEILDAAVTRCVGFSDLVSCASALSMKPNAIKSGALPDTVGAKIAAAQGHRRTVLNECETEAGPAAERACESAWLPGAPDEVTVFKRRGLLLQNDDRPGALDAYLAAARLAPRDRDVARAVVALSGATGRSDAQTLTARGAALMTLGRPADAILSLHEALRLAPDYAGAKSRLRIAEDALASHRRSRVTVAILPAATRGPAAQDDGAFSNEAPVTRSN